MHVCKYVRVLGNQSLIGLRAVVVIDSHLPLVVRARGDLVVLERRLVILVAASAVSEHSGDGTVSGRVDVRGATSPACTSSRTLKGGREGEP